MSEEPGEYLGERNPVKEPLPINEAKKYSAHTPAEVFNDTDLSDAACRLYPRLWGLARKTGYCFPTNEYLAQVTKKSRETIKRLIRELVERGYIGLESPESKNRKIIVFDLLDLNQVKNDPVSDPPNQVKNDPVADKKASQPGQKRPGNQVKNDPVSRSKMTRSLHEGKVLGESLGEKSTPIPPRGLSKKELLADFQIWYTDYPRKVGRAKAEKAWLSLFACKDPPQLSDMLTTLSWQKESWDWREADGKFIPHPATYLNQRRCDDDRAAYRFTPPPNSNGKRNRTMKDLQDETEREMKEQGLWTNDEPAATNVLEIASAFSKR